MGRRENLLPGGKPDRLGRVQKQIKRAFIASGGKPLRIADLLPRCYPAVRGFKLWHRTNVHRAIDKVARPIGRDGKGVIWGEDHTNRHR